MSKVLRPGEIAEVVETLLCNPEKVGSSWEEDTDRLVDFLEQLSELICTHFGGDVAAVSGPDYSKQEALKAGIVPDDCETDWCVHIQGGFFEAPQDHWTTGYDREGSLCLWSDHDQSDMNKLFGYGLYEGKGVPLEIEPWTGDPEQRFVEDAQEQVWEAFWENLRQEEPLGGMHWLALRHLQEINPLEVYHMRAHCLSAGLKDIRQLAEWTEKHEIWPKEDDNG